MNCLSFDTIVSDLARSELMEASVSVAAHDHAAECRRCQARLMDERSILDGLTALATTDREKRAIRWDENQMREVFRASQTAGRAQGSTLNPQLGVRHWRVGIAIAAALIILVGGFLVWRSRGLESLPDDPVAVTGPQKVDLPVRRPESTGNAVAAVGVEANPKSVSQSRVRAKRTSPREMTDASSVAVSLGEFQAITDESEETSDFFQLVPGGAPLASGRLVRVVMPRTAMAYFGMPVNVDRAEQQVKADVLFGEDNLARAIRFVR